MTASERSVPNVRSSANPDPNVQDAPWAREGILAGVLGAATVAVFFLVIDIVEGRPLWTPHALGTGLFRGAIPAAGAPIEPVFVAAYTVLHGGIFAAVGLVAAFELMTGTRLPGRGPGIPAVALAALLFVAFSALFAGFAALGIPEAAQVFGIGRIAVANLLASAAMALTLTYRSERSGAATRADA